MFKLLLSGLQRRGVAPQMSATERAALDAGGVWVDGELFSGRPDFARMLAEPYPELTADEQAFLDGPVEEVCDAVDIEWTERHKELSPDVWRLLREHCFFGLALPPEYDGHGFSALAMSTIFGKLASRSMALSTTVLIPNSVGPGELLVEVGTEAQKAHYLPRLARGDEIPCFALTEPEAGSDAASIQSRGVVFRGDDGGLYLRLDWQKRYITLAPIATLIGLAFRLDDPDQLLGGEVDVGITCALVSADLPGVDIGRRHDPMGIPFANGPTTGRGVVVPIDQIIGGREQAGRGWQMLMEALSGGRAISLPAQATVGAKHMARVAGAYSVVRQQFGMSIGRFEGIEEPLARIAGRTYLLDAARTYTCGAIDRGHRPAVISAMIKYNATEISRQLTIDAMDVLGGAALCRGPRNLVADGYLAAPIGITVEGANILTRTLIVFGQGAMRCHPHAHRLLDSIRTGDVAAFRSALVRHQLHVAANGLRSLWFSITGGRGSGAGRGLARNDPSRPYLRRLAWASASFAFWSDLAMMALGGKLKQRGKLTGRLADILSWMYLGFGAIRRWHAEGRRDEDVVLMRWAAEHSLAQIQHAFDGFLTNFDPPLVAPLVRGPVRWWHRLRAFGSEPSDRLGAEAARVLQRPGVQRQRLLDGLYSTPSTEPSALADLEQAFELAVDSAPILGKLRRAMRQQVIPRGSIDQAGDAALAAGVVSADEIELLKRAAEARQKAIQVDDFSLETLQSGGRAGKNDDRQAARQPMAAVG